MNIEWYRSFCLSKKGVTEEFPFGDETIVFKVMGKMFTLAGVEEFNEINVKCDPEKGAELREQYPAVKEAYHMNKKHWITVGLDGSIPPKLVGQWITESYDLVVAKLTKSEKLSLDSL